MRTLNSRPGPRAAFLPLLIIAAARGAWGQPILSGDYVVGQIPPVISVFRDQRIDMIIKPPPAGGALTAAYTAPRGAIGFVPGSGQFTYAPAPQDTAPFNVTFRAAVNSLNTVEQVVRIVPLAIFRPDHDYLQGKRAPPDDSAYVKYVDTCTLRAKCDGGSPAANGPRNVEISGRTVVLQPGGKEYGLLHYDGKATNGDVGDLKIYAETLIIRGPLHLPGANVSIWARELRMEDLPTADGATMAYLSITPKTMDTVSPGTNQSGARGQDAGQFNLFLQKYTQRSLPALAGYARLYMAGGEGQRSGPGAPGADGTRMTSYNPIGAQTVRGNPCSDFLGFDCTRTCSWPGASIAAGNLASGVVYIDFKCEDQVRYIAGTNAWPESGKPATNEGRPGAGGNGGRLTALVEDTNNDLVGTTWRPGGGAGAVAATVRGGASGSPSPTARHLHIRSAADGGTYYDERSITAGAERPGLPAIGAGQAGTATQTRDTTSAWLHPVTASILVSYMKDVYRDGNLELARSIGNDYLTALQRRAGNASAEDRNFFTQHALEVSQMLTRLDANTDYYGNPAGWAPLLSLATNVKLAGDEVAAAAPLLYLSFWLENYANDVARNTAAINNAKDALWQDLTKARDQYNQAAAAIPALQSEATAVQNDVRLRQAELVQLEQTLVRRAQNNVAERNKEPEWKIACRILSKICTVIPVYQPALGAVGAGLDFATNVDPNKPLETFQGALDVASRFSGDTFTQSSNNLKSQIANINPRGQSPAQYAGNLRDAVGAFSGAVDGIRSVLQPAAAPQSEVDAELQKLLATDDAFKSTVDRIKELNTRKASLVQKITDLSATLADSSQTINSHLLTLAELDKTSQGGVKPMDLRTVNQVKQMGLRAKDRLNKYFYYMAKSYEYSLLEPFDIDVRALDSGDEKLRTMVTAAGAQLQNNQEALMAPYKEVIRSVIDRGVTKIASNGTARQLNENEINLTAAELAALNAEGRVVIDLKAKLAGLFTNREAKRLTKLYVAANGIKVTPANAPQFLLGFKLTGDSVLTNSSALNTTRQYAYAFRFGTSEKPDPFEWTTTYSASTGRINSSEPAAADLQTLKSFLNLNVSDNQLQAFLLASPSAESQLVVTSTSRGVATITSLQILADLTFTQPAQNYGVLNVLAPPAGSPVINVSVTDLTSRAAGRLGFRRVYNQGTNVTLTAEPSLKCPSNTNSPACAALTFDKWVDGAGVQLSRSTSYTIGIRESQTVQPVYVGANNQPNTFSISGRLLDSRARGVGPPGPCDVSTRVTLDRDGVFTNTNGNGEYTFTGLAPGRYVVTPTRSGCVFSPASLTVNVTSADVTGNSFTSSPVEVAPLSFTPTTLPPATVNLPYAVDLVPAGGAPPYAFSVAGGSLPQGLRLAGARLEGSLATAGTSPEFVVRLTDSAGARADRAYTLSVIRPVTMPAITSIQSAADFGGALRYSSTGAWIEIRGTNLAATQRSWEGKDFNGNNAPNTLDGVRVTVNNRPAFIYYVSPTQVNAQMPADSGVGMMEVRLQNPAGAVATFNFERRATAPGILAPEIFRVNGRQYMVATFADRFYVGRPNLITGVAFRPAKPGDTIAAYGVGFGAVNPAFDPGIIVDKQNAITAPVTFAFGQTRATVTYSGLAPSLIGLYQFNITVPQVPDGDYQINVTFNGQPLPQPAMFLTVQR